MKAKFICVVCLLINAAQAETVCKLSEAIQKKLVTVQICGAQQDTTYHGEYSSHYGPCMALQVTNSTAGDLRLSVDYGYKLEPEDTALQTMMVTQTFVVKLLPRQKKDCRLFAMCTEATDGGPQPNARFYLRKRATGSLLELSELINRKKYQTDAAQSAVWCITNDHDFRSIFSSDTAMMYDLRRFVVKAKGISAKNIYDTDLSYNYMYTPRAPVFTTRTVYSGSFSYNITGKAKVLVALFDENNHMKKVYVNNETQPEGEYTYKYEIGSDETGDKKNYLRLFRDGKLVEEVSLIPHE